MFLTVYIISVVGIFGCLYRSYRYSMYTGSVIIIIIKFKKDGTAIAKNKERLEGHLPADHLLELLNGKVITYAPL